MSQLGAGGSRISAGRLAGLLGQWRRGDTRSQSTDLAAALRLLVLDGRLSTQTWLPAERELAEALGVSRTMIASTLDRLRDQGLIASRRGAGSWITLPGQPTEAVSWMPLAESEMLNLAQATPFAPAELTGALEAAQLHLPRHLASSGYQPLGLPELRERVAARYAARGLPTDPAQILITSGALHALAMALRLLVAPGQRVLLENPSYPNAIEAIRAVHAMPVPVAMAVDGWDLDGIEATMRQVAPRMAYLIPDFQNPTGLRLDHAGRERLAAALRRTRTVAVVDESLAELDLEGDPVDGPPPLAAFAENFVITTGSASKTFWGGIRIGWIRAPIELTQQLGTARASIDLGSSLLDQLLLTELMAVQEPMLRRRRAEFAASRDLMITALAEICPQWTVRRPDGGLSLWCELDGPFSTRLAVAASTHGLHLVPGSRFAAQGGLERWLRLPFALPQDQLIEAVRRLGQAAASLSGAEPLSVPVA